MNSKTILKLLSVAAAGAFFAVSGIDNTLTQVVYTVRSPKIKRPVSLVFLSDIHSQKYKDGGDKLLETVETLYPDFLLFGGDIFDKYAKEKEIAAAAQLVERFTEKYPESYFVLGNHEVDNKRGIDYKTFLADRGMKILGGESYELTNGNGQTILLSGADFIRCDDGSSEDKAAFESKNKFIEKAENKDLFSVFVRHVPTKNKGDEKIDLILSGHNHGGLWRFPNTDFGIAGGGEKLLPRYVHGEYKNGKSTMIVGSGIATDTYFLPRLYNVPEVVRVILLPEKI